MHLHTNSEDMKISDKNTFSVGIKHTGHEEAATVILYAKVCIDLEP